MVQAVGGISTYSTGKQFLDNNQKSSIFALSYRVSLLLFIFYDLQVHMIENGSLWEGGH